MNKPTCVLCDAVLTGLNYADTTRADNDICDECDAATDPPTTANTPTPQETQ